MSQQQETDRKNRPRPATEGVRIKQGVRRIKCGGGYRVIKKRIPSS